MRFTGSAWAMEEIGHADLGQAARTHRAAQMLDVMVHRPAGTVSQTFGVAREREGAYRLLENRAVTYVDLAAAQHVACARRCRGLDLVIAPIDGSSLAHTDTRHDDGVGPIGSRKTKGRGLKTMTLLVLTPEGVELGVGAHVLWARSETPDPTPHAKRALSDKESRHWTSLQHNFERTMRQEGMTARIWYQMDREADMHPVLMRGLESGVLFTVRREHNRNLAAQAINDPKHPTLKLNDELEAAPVRGHTYVRIPAGPKRRGRVACLELRFVHVTFHMREQWSTKWLGDVPLTAVWVREVGTCPSGEDPLDWSLLTTYGVTNFAEACEVVRAYSLRWRLETVHFTWKSGACHVEDAQLESFPALAKWATLQLSVAIELQSILHRARTEPTVPADVVFTHDEIEATRLLYRDHWVVPRDFGKAPSLGDVVRCIAEIGGYTGKSSGGPPGVKTFGRGMERVVPAARILQLLREQTSQPTPPDRSG